MEQELSDWVPEGWRVEVRKRKRGRYKTSNYTCYTDPITNLKFYSKPQVLSFLGSVSNNGIGPRKRGDYKDNKLCAESNVVAQELPPGWTVELRVRRRKQGCKRRTDKYYTDPETGRIFCSMKQVLHYLQTGDITDRKSNKKRLNDVKLRETPSLPALDNQKRVPEIKANKDFGLKLHSNGEKTRVPETKASKDLKLHSRGEGDGDQDRKATEKITQGTLERAKTFPEEKRKEGARYFPGNTSVSLPSQAKAPTPPAVNGKSLIIPERSTTLKENRISERGKDSLNDENEGTDAQLTLVEVDGNELTGKTMRNQAHEVSVIKLRGSNSLEVHRREEQVRDVLKKFQGPILLPAGYIPLPPAGHHNKCTFGSKKNDNVTDPLHYALTDPCFACGRITPTGGGDMTRNEAYALSTSANVWDDPCFHFAVKTLASQCRLPADSGIQ